MRPTSFVRLYATVAAVILLTAAASAQPRREPAYPPDTPIPETPHGTPSFWGVWRPDTNFIGNLERGLLEGEEIVMKPWAREVFDNRESANDPEANCLPTGIPRMAPYPWRILQSPTHNFFLFEGNIHSYRQIFTDGREFPDYLNPTWYGYSIGHWEGDTLVIETRGFNDRFWFDFAGHPHTEQLRTIERVRRIDFNTLETTVTIEDPGAYEKPFTTRSLSRLAEPGEELMEYICNENNKDVQHIQGPARIQPGSQLPPPL